MCYFELIILYMCYFELLLYYRNVFLTAVCTVHAVPPLDSIKSEIVNCTFGQHVYGCFLLICINYLFVLSSFLKIISCFFTLNIISSHNWRTSTKFYKALTGAFVLIASFPEVSYFRFKLTQEKLRTKNESHDLQLQAFATQITFRVPRCDPLTSQILNFAEFVVLWHWLPKKLYLKNPARLFSASTDGFALDVMMSKLMVPSALLCSVTIISHYFPQAWTSSSRRSTSELALSVESPHIIIVRTLEKQVWMRSSYV